MTVLLQVLGALVSITASCSVIQPWASLVIGFVGGHVAKYSAALLKYLGARPLQPGAFAWCSTAHCSKANTLF